MGKLTWDQVGTRKFETGVDHGVLFLPDNNGNYVTGVAWPGLTGVTESPSGAEPSPQYADNIKYLNLFSREEFGATIEAFTYPDEFNQFNGFAEPTPGVIISQQGRPQFGFSYRTRIGNDVAGDDLGYKIHLVYGCQASPSEQAHATVGDTPEAMQLSWTITTTPVPVSNLKNSAKITIDSTKVDPTILAAFELMLYGDTAVDPVMPLPNVVTAMFADGVDVATPVMPSFNSGTNTITIPTTTGVDYTINGDIVPAGAVVITENTIVVAHPKPGYGFPADIDNDWLYHHT